MITLNLNQTQVTALLNLLDAAVRASGLKGAVDATMIYNLLKEHSSAIYDEANKPPKEHSSAACEVAS